MSDTDLEDFDQRVLGQLHALLHRRYGRDRDARSGGQKVSLMEAGYGTLGAWWPLEDSLARSGTSFIIEDLQVRLDLMFQDLLLHPGEPLTSEWTLRYGYRSPSAATRAFRARFGVSVGDARRMGTLGIWLDAARRNPRSVGGVERRAEASERLRQFRRRMRRGTLGPLGTAALRGVGRGSSPITASRPRYPALAACERVQEDL